MNRRHLHLLKTFSAFTLIELLVVISIIAILASIAIPTLAGGIGKSQISKTASNYRQLYLFTENASTDIQGSGGQGAFPGDVSNSVVNWSNALVPAYCSATGFRDLGTVKGIQSNTLVWNVKAPDDPASVFLCTTGFSGTTNITLDLTTPFKDVEGDDPLGGVLVTLQGAVFTIFDTNSPSLTNGSAILSPNGSSPF